MPKRAVKSKGQSLSDVAANIELEAEQRRKRTEEYPMCNRLSVIRSDKAILMAFLDWLEEEKGVVLADALDLPGLTSNEKLLMSYFDIDEGALERERRRMLAAQRKANGDLDPNEEDT